MPSVQSYAFKLEDFVTGRRFVIPIYQRPYEWDVEQWDDLWDDLLHTAEARAARPDYTHFFGPVCTITVNDPLLRQRYPTFYLVDGQQRITTVAVLAKVYTDIAGEPANRDNLRLGPVIVRLRRLFATDDDPAFPRIEPGILDRPAFRATMNNQIPQGGVERIYGAYHHFRVLMQRDLDWTEDGGVHAIRLASAILDGLEIVQLALDNNERCYEVFQSLNARGTPLGEADKLRNVCFMYLAARPDFQNATQRDLYVEAIYNGDGQQNTWLQMEKTIRETQSALGAGTASMDDFIHKCGTFMTGHQFGADKSSRQLQDLLENRSVRRAEQDGGNGAAAKSQCAEEMVREISSYREGYRLAQWPDRFSDALTDIRLAYESLRSFGLGTAALPLLVYLFKLLPDADNAQASRHMRLCLRILEAYTVRRFLGKPRGTGKSDNRVYAQLAHELYVTNVTLHDAPQKIHVFLQRQNADNSWPTDDELLRECKAKNVYQPGRDVTKAIFARLEQTVGGHRPQAYGQNFQLEHILPRRQPLNQAWLAALGRGAQLIQKEYRNTLGNLVLLTPEENQIAGANEFQRKTVVYRASALATVTQVAQYDAWNQTSIEARCKALCDTVCQIWPSTIENEL